MPTAPPVVLIVEDDDAIRQFVRSSLASEGWHVHEAATVQRGLIEAGTRRPDLVIADLGLPDGDGVQFIRTLRGWSTVPVIVLSARTQEAGKVEALDAGADDYVTKPVGVHELLARTRAVLRRLRVAQTPGSTVLRFGDVAVDLVGRVVRKQDVEVHLTPIEFRLLAALVAHADRVITHRQLLREVWGPSHVESTQYLRVYMGNLRHKLEDQPAQPRHIVTELGVGYRLVTA
ncbi:two-component system response regulator KdpE [uncultured Aquincola sp.]|uniref:two-component system response regulator KdpE n=1 Tax=uncultured Aquincola sp. TaxID=886556 RepID=UPI0032B141E2